MKFVKLKKMALTLLLGFAAAPFALGQVQDFSAVDAQKVKEVLLQDLQKQGIDKQPEVQAAVKAAQDAVLLRAWEQQTLKANPVTPALRDEAYKDFLNLLGSSEYRLHHITLADQEQAKALIQRLQSGLGWDKVELAVPGKPDAKLAANKTDWVNMAAVMPEYREAIKLLKPGQVYPTPVRTNAGWHVLGLIETRALKAPAADQIKGTLDGIAQQKIVQEKIKSLLSRK